jgi:hypothetical protein
VNLNELLTVVDAEKKKLPKGKKAREDDLKARLKNNARKGERDAEGKAKGKLENKTPKVRAPKPPKVKKTKKPA